MDEFAACAFAVLFVFLVCIALCVNSCKEGQWEYPENRRAEYVTLERREETPSYARPPKRQPSYDYVKRILHVDLHGCFVAEALKEVEEALRQLRYHSDVSAVRIITGKGAHSPHNIPRIKPAVLSYLEEMRVGYRTLNEGAIMVYEEDL